MNIILRIKALSLLFYMLGMIALSSFPHAHHAHEAEHTHHSSALAHHHEHSNDEQSDQNHQHSFLIKLLETHSHESHLHEFQQLEFTVPSCDRAAVNIVPEVRDLIHSIPHYIDEETRLFEACSQHQYHDPDLHSYSHRGPPALG